MTTCIKIGFVSILLLIFYTSSSQVNLTNGLVANYTFTGNANDASGNGHNGTLVNGTSLTADRFGNANSAYFFDGIDDYIRITDNGAFSTAQISISLWFKTNSDALQNLIGKRKFDNDGTAAGGAQYQFFINYSPFPGIGSNLVGNVGNSCNTVTSSSYVNTGDVICKTKWYHAVITFDGTNHRIYIDGVLKLTTLTGFTSMLSCNSELRFGNWWSGGTIPFSGIMDDIRWYNRPLNQAEVTALYNNFPTSSSADFSFNQSACTPNTVQFANLTQGTTSIFWDFGNGMTNTTSQNPTITYGSYGNYPVKLRVQTSSGCKDSVVKVMTVLLQQDSVIAMRDTTTCSGAAMQLASVEALEHCWNAHPSLSSTTIGNPTVSPTATTTYQQRARITGANIIVNGNFSAGNTGFQSDYLNSATNTGAGQYAVTNNPGSWSAGYPGCSDHTSATGNMMTVNGSSTVGAIVWQQTVAVTQNTNYSFSVWVNSLETTNPANLRFYINGRVLPVAILGGTTTCSWKQYYANWNSGLMANVNIAIGNYNAGVSGNDFALDDISFAPVFLKQDTIKITVTPPPDLVPSADTAICSGESVQLNVTGASTVSWSPATGLSNSNIPNPVATPTVTTKYLVSGYNLPGCTGTDSVTITIKPKPVISRIADTGYCAGSPGIILFANAPGATQYNWTPATGLSSTTVSNPQASPVATTRYFVEVTGSNGCKSRDSVRVAVAPTPTVTTRSDTTICEGSPIALSTVVTGATRYSWSPARDLSDSSLASPIATPTQPTTYVITVSNNYCSASDAVSLSLYPAPVVTKSADTTICNQGRAQLSAGGGVSYSWTPATGLTSTSIANPVASPAAPTRYYVTVTGTNGCRRVDSINVGWQPRPVATISPASVAVCRGQSTVLTAAGGDAYDWYAGTNIQSRYTASTAVLPDAIQQYSVAVQHTFCRVSDTLRAAVIVNELPVVKASKANDIDCSNGSAVLSATGGTAYSWSPATAITGANTATPEVTPVTSTTYTVQATDANGCRNWDSVRVNVSMNPTSGGYHIVNAFTPNDDGKNDCFGLKFWGPVQNLDFSVYNRWGERVFHSKDPGRCWDGTYKGVKQPSGTYVYQVKATTVCGDVFRKGTVTLMR